MGSPPDEPARNPLEKGFDAEAPRRVTIGGPFYLGKYEVTQAQFEAVLGKEQNPSFFRPQARGADLVKEMPTDRLPVDSVSWDDADAFCSALAKKAGKKVTLPSEAQWEWACRAGTQTRWSCGDTDADLGDSAWYWDNSGGGSHPVGAKKPNAWGLYDVHGNVWQWCRDWYGPCADLPATDPVRETKGSSDARVMRGGSWLNPQDRSRAAFRNPIEPALRYNNVGFRVCVRLD
jgi:formylglycine-generating enzyme required for sulfatase activity